MSMPGTVSREFTAWCMGCVDHTGSTSGPMWCAAKDWRGRGWRKVGKVWFCPRCVRQGRHKEIQE